jgi:hypothetical protein
LVTIKVINLRNQQVGIKMSGYWLADFLEALEKRLPPAEQEYADALLGIAAKYGKLANGDGNGIWVGYVPAVENDNLTIGVKCSNCYFYESEKVCKIVAQEIEPNGYCRLAAMPDGVIKSMNSGMDDEEDE